MSNTQRTYLPETREALRLLGLQTRIKRKQAKMSESEFAERIGVARATVRQIEKGAPTVTVGLMFEAAAIAGVDLFVPEATSLAPHLKRARETLALLPKKERAAEVTFDNDF